MPVHKPNPRDYVRIKVITHPRDVMLDYFFGETKDLSRYEWQHMRQKLMTDEKGIRRRLEEVRVKFQFSSRWVENQMERLLNLRRLFVNLKTGEVYT